jgi:hypothetical protein
MMAEWILVKHFKCKILTKVCVNFLQEDGKTWGYLVTDKLFIYGRRKS